MCGLIGAAGFLGKKEEDAVRTLLILDSIRGEDSTGIAVVNHNAKVNVAKKMGDPFYLLNSQEYAEALKGANRAIIGHNRYATVGGVSEATAHPFEFPSLVGVHNGTLQGKWRLDDNDKYKVDSENLYHHMDKHGLADALKLIQGAWSLVWWDKADETLNFLRNKERPIWLTSSLDAKTLFWASEKWMLEVACNKHNIVYGDIWTTAVDKHISFNIGQDRKINKPRVKDAPSTYVTPVYDANKYGGHVQQGSFLHKHGGTHLVSGGGVTTLSKEEKRKSKLTLVKNPIAVISAGTIASYVCAKERTFEITGSRIDEQGSRYVTLMDVADPQHPVRLYLRRQDQFGLMIGREIVGTVSGFVNSPTEGEYFKVSPHGARVLPSTILLGRSVEDDESLLLYMGAGRRLFTKKEWSAKYSTCCNCFDRVYPDDTGNKLTPDGEVLCGNCCANLPAEYNGVKLMSVI